MAQVGAAAETARLAAPAVLRALPRDMGADAHEFFGLHTVVDRTDIYLAIGIVTERRHVSGADALAMLRGYAFAHDRLVEEVARDVLTGDLPSL